MKKFLTLLVLVFSFFIALNPVVFSYADDFSINAKSCILMDYHTGRVLYESNSDAKYPVASIVKLMTILLTLEEIDAGRLDLDAIITASNTAADMGGSQVFIEAGGNYKVSDLLKSVIISSANDASVLLAETIAGSESNFVNMMNKKATELGLDNTNYDNCTGLPAVTQFSSARDCAVLLKQVSQYDLYHKYCNIWMDKLSHPEGRETELVNTNKLIRYYKGCIGGKTGSTGEAGYCLSAVAKRGDMKLIAVVLGTESSKDRFGQTSKLFDYGFNNFENKKIISGDEKLPSSVSIKNGKEKVVDAIFEKDFYYINNKIEKFDIMTKMVLNKNLSAPIKKGDKLGVVYIMIEEKVIGEVDIISSQNVSKKTLKDNLTTIINNYYA